MIYIKPTQVFFFPLCDKARKHKNQRFGNKVCFLLNERLLYQTYLIEGCSLQYVKEGGAVRRRDEFPAS